MRYERIKIQYEEIKIKARTIESILDLLNTIRDDMEKNNPYKVMDENIKILKDKLRACREDMDFYLDRMNEYDEEN